MTRRIVADARVIPGLGGSPPEGDGMTQGHGSGSRLVGPFECIMVQALDGSTESRSGDWKEEVVESIRFNPVDGMSRWEVGDKIPVDLKDGDGNVIWEAILVVGEGPDGLRGYKEGEYGKLLPKR